MNLNSDPTCSNQAPLYVILGADRTWKYAAAQYHPLLVVSPERELSLIKELLTLFHCGYQLTGTWANCEDPDEMPHKAAFHQGHYCLLR